MQLDSLEFVLGENRMASRTFREKKTTAKPTLFRRHVDNRNRAGAGKRKGTNFAGTKKHEKIIAAVRKREILVASRIKISGSEKKNY